MVHLEVPGVQQQACRGAYGHGERIRDRVVDRHELQLEGAELDQHGYLVDIVHVEDLLHQVVDKYKDKTLNELPEFAGLNPSIEHFCRIVATWLSDQLNAPNISALTVKIWENQIAWASYSVRRD
ncbi:MAG: 6-carboxytetrahydropterin synthase [Caldilineaceae bacterium]|nr:6-carboxytetrahydropterin synthase [Caldilineaceae bacterium]